ncbi:MAG: hypothetical protein AMJ43_03545 [Coxiella sp. DG_40]|nr:MAG: hypothetical protein AMJ43_03545 [Coxiella sp. DG_40]
MLATHEKYIINEKGRKTAVVVPLNEWKTIQEMLEDLDDIKAFDKAMSKPSEPIPWDKALKELK